MEFEALRSVLLGTLFWLMSPGVLGWGQVNMEGRDGVRNIQPESRESCIDQVMFPSIYFFGGPFVSLRLPLEPRSGTRAPRDSRPDFPYCLPPWPAHHPSSLPPTGHEHRATASGNRGSGSCLPRGGGPKRGGWHSAHMRTAVCPRWTPDLHSTLFFLPAGSFGWFDS